MEQSLDGLDPPGRGCGLRACFATARRLVGRALDASDAAAAVLRALPPDELRRRGRRRARRLPLRLPLADVPRPGVRPFRRRPSQAAWKWARARALRALLRRRPRGRASRRPLRDLAGQRGFGGLPPEARLRDRGPGAGLRRQQRAARAPPQDPLLAGLGVLDEPRDE